ncbi:Bifunctional enzyme CysN/CysC [Emticicia aquatica]|jgi:sulfate adenylyltransferase subunit 1|uniref:sulfate adenylyltransferase n=1 Tax=Emticicia aquatica TaxID=1681835 RepID=A0ABM9AN41_9BACT|nr:GTP-binding protein [Emticicia aquatica]CAH0995232.1 Bifunctional enzyme CysN/CysC [Emticicia aquatica]
MDILRIATAGSVDDGKSTLIGRLLYETNSITKDKIEALESASKRKGLDFLDLSLLTDGLIAEREQGITIDVAHIYFSTPNRKYIIADTPGHFEYTRNMVTGASNTSVSIILIDARNGVVEQTKRHFYISSMLRIKNIVVAVNKMDLVGYSQERFNEIKNELLAIAEQVSFEGQELQFIPISSLYGENLVRKSSETPWYEGETLLNTLENVATQNSELSVKNARFPVQQVIRPKTEEFHDYRGYAGKIASGSFFVGDLVEALPSGQISKIKTIEKFGTKLETGKAKESVVITLEDNIDVSRGNMLVKVGEQPESRKEIEAKICWLDGQMLTVGKTYLLQHGINRVKAKVTKVNSLIDIKNMSLNNTPPADGGIKLNEIGWITIKTASPIYADKYEENPANGSFILIDEMNNGTVGIGFVE